MKYKEKTKRLLTYLHLDVTKNMVYDRLTERIIKRHLTPESNCIDIGCHKGEILDLMLASCPEGKHYAYEPIPQMFELLYDKYKDRAMIFPYALSDNTGFAPFYHVINAPAYSGLQKRKYDCKHPQLEEIQVATERLDDVYPENLPVHFVKIDVEGGEFEVLKGGKNLLHKYLPLMIFECGIGASDYYGNRPDLLFDLITRDIGLHIYTLQSFLRKKAAFTKEGFLRCYHEKREYYFVAATSTQVKDTRA